LYLAAVTAASVGVVSSIHHQTLTLSIERNKAAAPPIHGLKMDFYQLAEATSSLRRHLTNTNDSIVTFTKSQIVDDDINGDVPMLSKEADAELLLLATNFLLYVAMVLIITMICKIYFPEALERSQSLSQPTTRNIQYRRCNSNNKKKTGSSGYDSSDDDEEDEEEEENPNPNNDSLEYEDEELTKAMNSNKTNLRSSFVPLEFDQENATKVQVMKRLGFCVLMLNATFVTWGLLQERMLTRRYPRHEGEFFTYSYALVFTNRFWTLIMSGCLWYYLKPKRSSSTVIYEFSFPSISNMLSSWCQYESLRYVSFPAVTLFKSFKLAPVMLMGKVLGNKNYPEYDYYVALAIGIGITMFISSTDELKFGYNIYDVRDEHRGAWTGIMLLSLFLVFDSFTGQWQSRMFQRHRDLSMVELMFAMSAFSSLLSFITLVHSNELWPAIDFVYKHSEIHIHFFLFSIASTIGQLFIFYTIQNFGAVVFTFIMMIRVILSIALSCYIYGHQVTNIGLFGLTLVVSAILYRIKRKAEGSQLIKWRGMDDDTRAHQLVQEWHEHADM